MEREQRRLDSMRPGQRLAPVVASNELELRLRKPLSATAPADAAISLGNQRAAPGPTTAQPTSGPKDSFYKKTD